MACRLPHGVCSAHGILVTDLGDACENFREFFGRFGPHAGLAAGRCRSTITHVIADSSIHCRVTSETKALVRRLAEREGTTESALLKRLLAGALHAASSRITPTPARQKVSRGERLHVRLERDDWQMLRERSAARGMASATYVYFLVRSHLRGGAPLPKAEYLALKRSVIELTTIGRNLNQIARATNQGGRPPVPGRQEVGAMIKVAEGLRDHFRELLSANERAWRSDAEAPR